MRIGIIGLGKAGLSMALLLKHAGHELRFFDHHQEACIKAADRFGQENVVSQEDLMAWSQWVMLSVTDDQIQNVCDRLIFSPNTEGVCHLSGALGPEALGSAPKHVLRAAIHPIRAFASITEKVSDFDTTFFGFSGVPQAQALAVWQLLLPACADRLIAIPAASRALYHSAAVMASNFVVPLLAAALEAYRLAGVPEQSAKTIIHQLVASVLDNFEALPLEAVLTGPLVRGDTATTQKHLETLKEHAPQLKETYQHYAQATLPLAKEHLSDAQFAAVSELLRR